MAVPSEAARIQLIQKALAAAEKAPSVERARFPWRNGFHTSAVVELPVGSVLLNPRSHRIRAQLESSAKKAEVEADPYGEVAQKEIAALLRKTPDFDALRDNLRHVKQRDYGLVSHTGLLVNANTRCVALRDNETQYLRVAVLPQDATSEEIDRLELQLQMQQEFRQAYTFSNELLFIHDLINEHGYSNEKVALEMQWAASDDAKGLKNAADEVQKRVRILVTVRELQHLSEGRVPLTWLDQENKQAMLDLDGEMEKLKKQDIEAARRIRNNRLLGMLAGMYYRDLREVDADFVDRYLLATIEDQSLFVDRFDRIVAAPPKTAPGELKGMDVLDDAPVGPTARVDIEPFLERVARSHAEKRIALIDDGEETVQADRVEVIAQLHEALSEAAAEAKLDRKHGALQDRPRTHLLEAAKQVRKAGEAFLRVKSRNDFKIEAFKAARADLTGALASLDILIAADGK